MVEHQGVDVPVFKIIETQDQLQIAIRLRDSGGEHLSLHQQRDGTILKTYWSETKPRGTWDELTVETARKLGYRDPERHGNYYFHTPLFETMDMNGHELVGRLVKLADIKPAKARDQKLPSVRLLSSSDKFMAYIHLSTPEHPFSPSDTPHVSTALGDIYFRLTDPVTSDA